MNNTNTLSAPVTRPYDGTNTSEIRLIRWTPDSADPGAYGLCRVYYMEYNLRDTEPAITGWNTDILCDRMYGDVSAMWDEAQGITDAFSKNPVNAWEHPEISFHEDADNYENSTYTLTPYTPDK